jgi:hypothetical protein
MINSKYARIMCLTINYGTYIVLLYLYTSQCSHCLLGQPSEMSGGGRSRSLADIRSLRDTTDTVTGGEPRVCLSYYSEAEGLELLSQDSPGDPLMDSNVNALENVTSLLDYESDEQERDPNVGKTASSAEDPQLQAAWMSSLLGHHSLQ